MAWEYIEYKLPTSEYLHKQLLWISTNCNIYFALKKKAEDSWVYYAGDGSGKLISGKVLTEYSTEGNAQTNKLITIKDSNNKVLAILPKAIETKYIRLYVETGSNVNIYEWRPSTYFTAHEIVSGELELSASLSDAPLLKVVKDQVDRIKIGNITGAVYGIAGYNDSAATIFEISDNKLDLSGWTLTSSTLSSNNITLDSANDKITVNTITIDGANNRIRSSNYVAGIAGEGFNIDQDLIESGNVAIRGKIRSAVFQADTVSAVGGNIVILSSDVLATNMTASSTNNISIGGDITLVASDILRIKDGIEDEWLEVTGTTSNSDEYTVTRDKESVYLSDSNPTWKKGSSLVNYGQSGSGGILLTSSESDSPYISVFTHSGSPWSDEVTRMRFGNLNNFLGFTATTFGIAIGNDSAYLKYDPTDGMRIRGNLDAVTITGGVIIGADFMTATSGRRLLLNSAGLYVDTGATTGTYDATTYSNLIYGDGILLYIGSSTINVPIYFNAAANFADIHLYNRGIDPIATSQVGDIACVTGVLKICTTGGAPGIWDVVGSQHTI